VIGPVTLEVRGRRSGRPRSNMVTWVEHEGDRYFVSMLGEGSEWVRNLRAAGGATITVRGRKEEVHATELDPTQRIEFFRDVLGPVARGIPFGAWFIRTVDGVDLDDPLRAADGRVVFELHARR
jgi:deazaflavin-dependent oxidoreductase (nitroreductase family)